ncbi:MAG TPA: hypothetical protein VE684_16410 [Crenalkalicoccus sp.]|nr:hypothetical protein [Crenalkalicoccus sp.]
MKQQRGEHETRRDEGGPGSSHQGGSHGAAHRDRDDQGPIPGSPTNTSRSRVSGGGGERDRHHTHRPETRS